MPRAVVPSTLKNLKTYTVLVTQTTEEEIWSHMQSQYKIYTKNTDRIKSILDAILDQLYDSNPYQECSWRHESPQHYYSKDEMMHYLYKTENETQELSTNLDIIGDLAKCNRAFKWEQDEEYGDEYRDMDFEIDQNRLNIISKQDEIICMDRLKYNEAKQNWEERNKDYVEKKKLQKNHDNHIDYKEMCTFCDKRKQLVERQQKYEEEELEKEKQRELEKQKEREIKNKQKQEKEEVIHNCKQCNYMTTDQVKFAIHLGSKEHLSLVKLKSLYCESCKTQCRSENEYDSHCLSSKHKKAIGEIKEEKEFVCKACNYTTFIKCNYDLHCKTKRHIEKL
jgi:hypothetical protein